MSLSLQEVEVRRVHAPGLRTVGMGAEAHLVENLGGPGCLDEWQLPYFALGPGGFTPKRVNLTCASPADIFLPPAFPSAVAARFALLRLADETAWWLWRGFLAPFW